MAFNLFSPASRPRFLRLFIPGHFPCRPSFSVNAFLCISCPAPLEAAATKITKASTPRPAQQSCGGFRMNAFVHGKSIAPGAFLVNKPGVKKLQVSDDWHFLQISALPSPFLQDSFAKTCRFFLQGVDRALARRYTSGIQQRRCGYEGTRGVFFYCSAIKNGLVALPRPF